MGHMPVVCSDGIAVLDMVTAHPDIDLILMDIDLPGAWGEQLIEIIRGSTLSRAFRSWWCRPRGRGPS